MLVLEFLLRGPMFVAIKVRSSDYPTGREGGSSYSDRPPAGGTLRKCVSKIEPTDVSSQQLRCCVPLVPSSAHLLLLSVVVVGQQEEGVLRLGEPAGEAEDEAGDLVRLLHMQLVLLALVGLLRRSV